MPDFLYAIAYPKKPSIINKSLSKIKSKIKSFIKARLVSYKNKLIKPRLNIHQNLKPIETVAQIQKLPLQEVYNIADIWLKEKFNNSNIVFLH